MDPLGRGRYQGQWVPKADLRQFASRFTTASGSPYCAVVKRGEQSSVERLRRQMREQTRSLRDRARHGQGRDHDRPGTGAAGRGQGHRGGAPMKGG